MTSTEVERTTTRNREEQPLPPLNFWEKITVVGLTTGALGVGIGTLYAAIKAYEYNPLLLLLPAGGAAIYLGRGYDDWKATCKK